MALGVMKVSADSALLNKNDVKHDLAVSDKDDWSVDQALRQPLFEQKTGIKTDKGKGNPVIDFSQLDAQPKDTNSNVCMADFASLHEKINGLDTLKLDSHSTESLYRLYAANLVFDKTFAEKYNASVKDMFKAVYNNACAKENNIQSQSLQHERQEALKKHKPGQKWVEQGIAYQLTAKGELLKVNGKTDVTWVGTDGSAYEKHGNSETWYKNDAQIQKNGNDYKYVNNNGDLTEVRADAKAIVRKVGDLQIQQYRDKNIQPWQLDMTAIKDMSTGELMLPNRLIHIADDAAHNRLAKDSNRAGTYILSADGKLYSITKGKLSISTGAGKDGELSWKELGEDERPAFLKRNADGSWQFDTTTINTDDSIFDSKNQFRMADKATSATAVEHGRTVTLSAEADRQIVDDGKNRAVFDTKNGTYKETGPDHKEHFSYNFNTHVARGDGITFYPDHTHIDGTNFSVGKSGIFSDNTSKYFSGGSNSSVSSILGEVTAIAASGHITPDMICLLQSELAFLRGIQIDTAQMADEVHTATQVVASSLVRAEQIQSQQLAWRERHPHAKAS
jgi:hypothetical protein